MACIFGFVKVTFHVITDIGANIMYPLVSHIASHHVYVVLVVTFHTLWPRFIRLDCFAVLAFMLLEGDFGIVNIVLIFILCGEIFDVTWRILRNERASIAFVDASHRDNGILRCPPCWIFARGVLFKMPLFASINTRKFPIKRLKIVTSTFLTSSFISCA
jgi:hypothetical protein